MIKGGRTYADGFEAGRKNIIASLMRTLDGMESAYLDNIVKWEEDEEGYDEKALDAREVISDLRKVLRMLA